MSDDPQGRSPEVVRERIALAGRAFMLVLAGLLLAPLRFPIYLASAPIAALLYRHGPRVGVISVFILALVAGVDTPMSFIRVLLFLGSGVVLGEALRDGIPPGRVLVMAALATFVAYVATDVVERIAFGIDRFAELESMLLEAWQDVGSDLGMDIETFVSSLMVEIRRLYPGVRFLQSLGLALVSYWLLHRTLKRLGAEVPGLPPFYRWRYPWYVVWGYILGVGLLMVSGGNEVLITVGQNVTLVFSLLFLIQGAAVAWFMFVQRRAHWLVVGGVAALVAWQPLLLRGLELVGALDAWLDFRKIDRSGG